MLTKLKTFRITETTKQKSLKTTDSPKGQNILIKRVYQTGFCEICFFYLLKKWICFENNVTHVKFKNLSVQKIHLMKECIL